MPEFINLLPPSDALQRLLSAMPGVLPVSEVVDTKHALGRVTASPVLAPFPLPPFPRSTVDGYAVHAADTYGASNSVPIYLKLMGEIHMGFGTDLTLVTGSCALIHTGGMLPMGADSVVMIEVTQSTPSGEIEFFHPVAVGENIIQVGEDVDKDEEVIHAGVKLRPAEIGGLMALGITQVAIIRKPRIGLISSGDEIVPPESQLQPGQVHDINTYTLSGIIKNCGGLPVEYGILPDEEETLLATAVQALSECDAVAITAGSSASVRDLTAQVINALGKPGVLVHGVNIRPGKPTILAVCDGKPVIGLPGNPVSALVVANLFVVPVVESLLGLQHSTGVGSKEFSPTVRARLLINIPSQAGREDWVPVRLTNSLSGIMAEPLFGKSNLIFTLVRANGLVYIPPEVTGWSAGEIVEVKLL